LPESGTVTLSDLSKLGHQQTGLWVVASSPEVDSNADRPDDSACLTRSDATAAVGVSVPLEPGMRPSRRPYRPLVATIAVLYQRSDPTQWSGYNSAYASPPSTQAHPINVGSISGVQMLDMHQTFDPNSTPLASVNSETIDNGTDWENDWHNCGNPG